MGNQGKFFSFYCRSDFANGDETHIWRRKHTHMEMKHAQRSGWHSNVPEISAVFFFHTFLLFSDYFACFDLFACFGGFVSVVSLRWSLFVVSGFSTCHLDYLRLPYCEFQTYEVMTMGSLSKHDLDGSDNVIRKCNLDFLQLFLNYSKPLSLQNVFNFPGIK